MNTTTHHHATTHPQKLCLVRQSHQKLSVGGHSPPTSRGGVGIKNPQKRVRRHANNSPNLPASQTKRTQGRNILFRGTPHFDFWIYVDTQSI